MIRVRMKEHKKGFILEEVNLIEECRKGPQRPPKGAKNE